MANPDDSDFESFVDGVLNASFSSGIQPINVPDDYDHEDIILHNIRNNDPDSDDEQNSEAADQSSIPQALNSTGKQCYNDKDWIDVTDNDEGPRKTIPIYNVNKGPNIPTSFDSETRPIDYFYLFFNEDILNYICKETNDFANKRKATITSPRSRLNKWVDISNTDLKAFLGVVLNMGLIPLSNIESYFSTKWTQRIPFFSDVFTKDSFLNFFWNIHFNHSEGRQPRKKGFLIRPIVDHMKTMCQLFYSPSDFVAVDESTISFKGRVSFRVYNPQKPVKFGMKLFVLSDCENGYIYNFIPYFGKETLIKDCNLLKTTQIVKTLSESVVYRDKNKETSGLHVYTDRYYTSPELAAELLKINCNLTGTVMNNRTGMPPGLKLKSKKMKKGEVTSYRKGDTMVLCWRDKRVVTMLSTYSKGGKKEMTEVPNKWPDQPPVPKPNVVLDYTKHMGAVDRSDHFISSYQFMRRTKKWYRKIFFWLLEVAVVNSYLLYKNVQGQFGQKAMNHAEFRLSLIEDLVAERMALRRKRKRGRKPQGPPEERLMGRHFLSKKQKGTRCVVCIKKGQRKDTIYFCKTCVSTPSLHPDECFEIYHTQKIF